MSKDKNPTSSEDFDLFANPVDNHLAEELAKGTFSWTNKYTKVLGVLTAVVALLSVGAWYGHHSATSNSATSATSLRSTFARIASSGGFGGGSGASSFGGGSGGGFGVRITGSIAKVSGSTVTITLADPTQAASLKAGDNARITDTGAAGAPAGGFAGSASTTGGFAGAAGTPASGGAAARTSKGGFSSSSKGAASGTAGATGATRSGGAAAGSAAGSAARGGGMFSNPALTACLTKAGVTITAGQRPNFQDPTTMSAIQSCMQSLGLTFGGGAGGGNGGGYAGRASGAGAPAASGAPATTTP